MAQPDVSDLLPPGVDMTEQALQRMSNAQLDDLFRSSRAGPIPDGKMRGTVLLMPGTRFCGVLARFSRLLAWQGKVVDADRGELRNLVSPIRVRAVRAVVAVGESWADARPCIVIDYSRTSFVARWVRDEIREVGRSVYLGVVWLRGRRVAWFALQGPDRS